MTGSPNPQTIDLSNYLILTDDGGADPYDPGYTQRVFARSLLKEGATLALQQLVEREQTWPLLLGPFATTSALMSYIAEVNQAINTPGALVYWQTDGASQPTYYDLLSGELQIAYSYRKEQAGAHYTQAKLLTFSSPLGHPAAPRPYAAASAVGPLLMISPYASGGALAIGASTQAGVAGYGGQQQGASSGVFYWGSPSLAGDAQAELQISYVGPLPAGATATGVTPYVAVSLLPDALYQPLITAPAITFANLNSSTAFHRVQTSVASSYLSLTTSGQDSVFDAYSFSPLPESETGLEPTLRWSGPHRLFAIARASGAGGVVSAALVAQAGPLIRNAASVAVTPVGADWGLYDLGTFALRPSEFPQAQVQVQPVLTCGAGASGALDVAAFAMLPDATTWFMNPTQVNPAQYGYPPSLASPWGAAPAAWSNTVVIDDTLGDQFLYLGQGQTFAPSPAVAVPSSTRMTQFTRGLVPRPDPKDGLPIIAVLGVGQAMDPAISVPISFPTYSVGPLDPSTAADDSSNGGTVTWANTGNAFAVDDQYASVALTAGQTSEWLKLTGFGFAIPAAATIVGILMTVYADQIGAGDQRFQIVKGGTVQSATLTYYGGGAYSGGTYTQWGGPTNLFGLSWAASDINSSGFGAAAYGIADEGQSCTAEIDAITMEVWYTFGTPPVSFPGASQANPQNLHTMAQVNILERARYVLP